MNVYVTLHKKWNFSLRISLVNVNKLAVFCGVFFGYTKKFLTENFIFCAAWMRSGCYSTVYFNWCVFVSSISSTESDRFTPYMIMADMRETRFTVSFVFKLIPCLDSLKLGQKQPPEVFCIKRYSWKFAKLTGKDLYQRLFLNKVAGLCPATLLKKRLCHRYFPVKIFKSTFFTKLN